MRSHETELCYARDRDEVQTSNGVGGGVIRASALKKISRVNPPSEITFPAGIDFDGSSAVFSGTLGGAITQTVVSSEMRFHQREACRSCHTPRRLGHEGADREVGARRGDRRFARTAASTTLFQLILQDGVLRKP